jgi:hypothetical protein
LQMATENIIRGISFVNPEEHFAISNYKSRIPEGEEGVHVIEMPTTRADYLGGKWRVFGRFITKQEHMGRMKEYMADPERYFKEHIQSLG